MDQLREVVKKVNKLKQLRKTFLIAIDGFGGSGKSTLAIDLAEKLDKVSIVMLDDFYSPELKGPDRLRILEQVLKPLKLKRKAKYQIYNWTTKTLGEWKGIEPGGILIIEGVYALHPDFENFFDLTIWIDISQEEAAKRGISRDLNEYKIDTKSEWENDWMPQEKEYFETTNPKNRADIVFLAYK